MEKTSINDVKKYWDDRPCNIRHSNAALGTKEYFDEVEKRKYFVEPHILGFADFPAWRNKEVLEIGCGIGTDAVNFARNGAIYTGVELSQNSLAITKQRFDVYNLKGTFFELDVELIDQHLSSKDFDLIYSFGVLHHTPSIAKALAAIRRLCTKQTLFKFMVYAKHSWKQSLIEAGLEQPEAQFGCPIANTYTKEEIIQLLYQHDFQVKSIEQNHIFPYKVEEYKKYHYVREDWFSKMPDEVFNALERSLGWHLLITATPR